MFRTILGVVDYQVTNNIRCVTNLEICLRVIGIVMGYLIYNDNRGKMSIALPESLCGFRFDTP